MYADRRIAKFARNMIPHHNPERGGSAQIFVVTCKAQYLITVQQAAAWNL